MGITMGRGHFWKLYGLMKNTGSLCCSIYSKRIIQSSIMACNRRDHSVFNNGTTCDAAFRQNSLTSCYYFETGFAVHFKMQVESADGELHAAL